MSEPMFTARPQTIHCPHLGVTIRFEAPVNGWSQMNVYRSDRMSATPDPAPDAFCQTICFDRDGDEVAFGIRREKPGPMRRVRDAD